MRFLKLGLFLILLAVSLEMLARHLASTMPFEVQQNYNSTYPTNGHGARADWPDSNKLQIAILGSSILAMNQLSKDQTWISLLEKQSPVPIQIDNYGVGFNKLETMLSILQSFKNANRHYDIIILQTTADEFTFKTEQALSGTYQSRWIVSDSVLCASCELLSRFVKQRVQLERKFLFWLDRNEKSESALASAKRMIPPNGIFDNARYQKALADNQFIDSYYELPEPLKKHIETFSQKIASTSLEITKNVIWMPEGIAYHDQMLPSYLQKYLYLIPMKAEGDKQHFLSAKAFASSEKTLSQNLRDIWLPQGITEMNWINPITNYLPKEEDLFVDEFHLSEKGSLKVAEILKPMLFPYIEQVFKNRNK